MILKSADSHLTLCTFTSNMARPMKFSINTVLFVSPFTNADTRLFKQFKKWGYDAVELLVEGPAHIDPVVVKRELDHCSLACGSVAAAINPQRDLRGNLASQRNGELSVPTH